MTVVVEEILVDMMAVIKGIFEYLSTLVSWLILLVVFGLMISGCEPTPSQVQAISNQLPDNATNIEYIGNGWYTFEITEGLFLESCFLYKEKLHQGFITEVPCG